MVSESNREKAELHAANMKLTDEKEELLSKDQINNVEIEQLAEQVKELGIEINRLQQENEETNKQYSLDLDKISENFRKDIEAERDSNLQLMQKRDLLEHEKEILNIEITDKDAIIMQKNNEISIYTQELEQNK